MRLDPETKAELHQRTEELQEALWEVCFFLYFFSFFPFFFLHLKLNIQHDFNLFQYIVK